MDKTRTWIIGWGGTEKDGVDIEKVIATKSQIKKYLAASVREARDCDKESFDYGYTSVKDIEERSGERLYATAVFSGYHYDYEAYPEDVIPVKMISDKEYISLLPFDR